MAAAPVARKKQATKPQLIAVMLRTIRSICFPASFVPETMIPPGDLAHVDGVAIEAQPAAVATARGAAEWSRLIALHQHRVVLSLVAAGFSFERARELASEAWTRLMDKARRGELAELKLPGLAIVQARFLAWDERRREALLARHQADEGSEHRLVDRKPEARFSVRRSPG
jgi:hypothetical protein